MLVSTLPVAVTVSAPTPELLPGAEPITALASTVAEVRPETLTSITDAPAPTAPMLAWPTVAEMLRSEYADRLMLFAALTLPKVAWVWLVSLTTTTAAPIPTKPAARSMPV